MSERFYVAEPIQDRAHLHGDEARHLAQVMRRGAGSEVTLFDGSGYEFRARVESVGRAAVELVVIEKNKVDRELPFELVVATAVPKGERFRWMIEKITELGVTRYIPLVTTHSVVTPRGSVLQRMRRVVIEASKQCGRNRLMEIEALTPWKKFVDEVPREARRFFGAERAAPMSQLLEHTGTLDVDGSPCTQIVFAIGPEGGFASAEIEVAETAGWIPGSFGRRVLRVETAAVATAAAMAVLIARRPHP